jgi:hypothetical protein
MNYNGSFNPKYLTNCKLFFAKDTATVSSWNDQSVSGYDLSQGVALQQPTIGTDTVNFVPNQHLFRNVANAFSSDSEGYFFFNGIYDNSGTNRIFSSTDSATNNFDFLIAILNAGAGINRIAIANIVSGTTNTTRCATTALVNGSMYYGWIRFNGSAYTGWVNGVSQTMTPTTGVNNGLGFSAIANRDNICIGASLRSTPVYGNTKLNKFFYISGSLSASDLWKCQEFIKNPLNYQ